MRLVQCVYNTRKRTLLMILGIIYMLSLVIFGFIYWEIANATSGEYFVFENDINMNTKINVLKKKLNLDMKNKEFNYIARKLINSEEYRRPIVKIETDKDKNAYNFIFDGTLGENWANYYYYLFQEKGITHMKIDNIEKKMINRKVSAYEVDISLYKTIKIENNDEYLIYKKEDSNSLVKMNELEIYLRNYPFFYSELFQADNCFYPLSFYFVNILENSISFLDDSPLLFMKISKGNFKYPLVNFLYFSAVTITTLGYGDILPNSTLVRVLVMFETIIGVVITGMFASCLFWNRK